MNFYSSEHEDLDAILIPDEDYYNMVDFFENLKFLKIFHDMGMDINKYPDRLTNGIAPCMCGQCYDSYTISFSLFECALEYLLSKHIGSDWIDSIEHFSSWEYDKDDSDSPIDHFPDEIKKKIREEETHLVYIENFFCIFNNNKDEAIEIFQDNESALSCGFLAYSNDLLISTEYFGTDHFLDIALFFQRVLQVQKISSEVLS